MELAANSRRLESLGACQHPLDAGALCGADAPYLIGIAGCEHEPDLICVEHAQWFRSNDRLFYNYKCKVCGREDRIRIWLPRPEGTE